MTRVYACLFVLTLALTFDPAPVSAQQNDGEGANSVIPWAYVLNEPTPAGTEPPDPNEVVTVKGSSISMPRSAININNGPPDWHPDAHPPMPAVVAKAKALEFRNWHPDVPLEDGPFGTSHPPASADVTSPGIVMLPLLAFDASGYRLGYGGGYYDRTLADMKSSGSTVLAVGIAYQSQQVDAVPHGELDQRLDWVVTENGTHQFS